jgi:hypothetical protein
VDSQSTQSHAGCPQTIENPFTVPGPEREKRSYIPGSLQPAGLLGGGQPGVLGGCRRWLQPGGRGQACAQCRDEFLAMDGGTSGQEGYRTFPRNFVLKADPLRPLEGRKAGSHARKGPLCITLYYGCGGLGQGTDMGLAALDTACWNGRQRTIQGEGSGCQMIGWGFLKMRYERRL